jgi:hypothetical protein
MNPVLKRLLLSTAVATSVLTVLFSFTQAKQWYDYESKGMGFKIKFPKKPQESAQEVSSTLGKLKINTAMFDGSADVSASNIAYAVSLINYLSPLVNSKFTGDQPALFRGALDGAANNVQGKIVAEKTISFKNYPGREAKITMQDETAITCRCILVQNKMYVLMVVSAVNRDTNADVTKFLDSFDLE